MVVPQISNRAAKENRKRIQTLVTMSSFDKMMEKAKSADGFIAALDQSGGSTPKALKAYGVPDDVSD